MGRKIIRKALDVHPVQDPHLVQDPITKDTKA